MFRTILVPLDGSPFAEQALPLALGIARRSGGAVRLALVHEQDFRGSQVDADTARAERAYLDAVAARIRSADGPPIAVEFIEKSPVALALADHAREAGADLMVLTSHGRGPLSRFWLGSVADALLRHATVPLLIHRPTPEAPTGLAAERPLRRILVPLDGSEASLTALDPAAGLARLYGAGLLLLRAVVPPLESARMPGSTPAAVDSFLDALTAAARADLDRTARQLRPEGLAVDFHAVVHGSAAAAVLDAAGVVDLIALATHGRGRVARFFLGSVADKVVRAAPCPVLVVPSHSRPGGPS